MKRIMAWKNSLSAPKQMLVDLLVNAVIIGLIYSLSLILFDKHGFRWPRVIFAGVFGTLIYTGSLKWKNVKALFRS